MQISKYLCFGTLLLTIYGVCHEDMSKINEIECLNRIKKIFASHQYICNANIFFLQKMFNTITPSKDNNKFPDFFFEGGIVEHFIVTGSKDSKKGCDYKIEENIARKQAESYFKKKDADFFESPKKPRTMSTASTTFIYNKSSYDNFIYSFKKHFDDHLVSLNKNDMFRNCIVVFIIEQQDGRLCIFKDERFKRFYTLSEDKIILQYLKDKYPMVDYVIFNCSDSLEIIDISKIEDLLRHAKEGLDIRVGRFVGRSLKIYADVD